MRTWLRDIRTKKGILQEDMSKKIGVSRAYYSRIENGYRQQKMSIDMAQKLADVLEVPIDTILRNESEKEG